MTGIARGLAPQFDAPDTQLGELLEACVRESLSNMLEGLELGLPMGEASAPLLLIEYGRRLGQRYTEHPLIVMLFAKMHRRLISHAWETLDSLPISKETLVAAGSIILEETWAYVERTSLQARNAYLAARDEVARDRANIVTRAVTALIDDNPAVSPDLSALSGYDLRDQHLALVLWADDMPASIETMTRLRDASRELATAAGCTSAPLFIARDAANAWVWLATGNGDVPWRDLARALSESRHGIWAAAGLPERGIDGFRRSHRQAYAARTVALAPGTPVARVTLFRDVAVIAPMCDDLDSARSWLHSVLGDLSANDERSAELRETARTFLANGGSYIVTAAEMHVHRNTAQYRIAKAEEMLGHPLREARLDVEMALAACYWLGSAILAAPDRGS